MERYYVRKSVMHGLLVLLLMTFAAITILALVLHSTRTGYRTLKSVEDLDSLLALKEERPLLVDLRDRADYDKEHISGFLNIPWDDGGARLEMFIKPYHKRKPVVLICYGGNRSSRAFERLVRMGYKNVVDYAPGYTGYFNEKGAAFTPESGSCNCPY
jgi:rhodanese-related sulfurtransferase